LRPPRISALVLSFAPTSHATTAHSSPPHPNSIPPVRSLIVRKWPTCGVHGGCGWGGDRGDDDGRGEERTKLQGVCSGSRNLCLSPPPSDDAEARQPTSPPSCARPAPSPPAFPRKQLQHIGVGPMSTRHMKGLTYQCHACSCSVAKLVTVHAPLPLARRSAAEADAARGRRRRCP